MRKAVFVGIVAFLLLILVRLPAGISLWFIPENSQVRLLAPEGTLWSGSSELLVQGISIGTLRWDVRPVTFLRGRIGYDLLLAGAGTDLSGDVAAGVSNVQATIEGRVDGAFVNRWLAPYHIELAGVFDLQAVNLELQGRSLTQLAGRLTWDGGPVRYQLSGKMHDSVLPPMMADLGPGPAAVAYAKGESIPLLQAALTDNGFARIGVTKYLTRILGQPWPGGDPDHAVVLEVEEQLF